MNEIIERIRTELRDSGDEATERGSRRFFKEEVRCYGVKAAVVGRIARTHWKHIKDLEKKEIFGLCEELYRTGYCEDAFVASQWAQWLGDRRERSDLAVLGRWIEDIYR